MQSKSYNYAVKDLYLKFNILHIPQSHIHQLLKLAHTFVHHIIHKQLSLKTFASYFTINNTVHSLHSRIKENLHYILPLSIKILEKRSSV